MPMPWEDDPNDPLQERPAAVLWRVFTIALPFALFLAALAYALVKQSVR